MKLVTESALAIIVDREGKTRVYRHGVEKKDILSVKFEASADEIPVLTLEQPIFHSAPKDKE